MPGEVFWIIEAKMPKAGMDGDDKERLYQLLMEAKAAEAEA
jgi:hypothetical protein